MILKSVYRSSIKKVRKGFLLFYKNLIKRNERGLDLRLVNEFFDVLNNKGRTINARNNLYLTAMDNRYNLRYVINYKLENENKKKSLIPTLNDYKKLSFTHKANYYTKLRENNFDLMFNYYEK